MVKQQLFRMDERGNRTVASSLGIKNSVWLQLLEQQFSLVDYNTMSVPTFYQYPLGRGIVMSRCIPDPTGRKNSYLAHQLVFDEADDLQQLMNIRPLSTRSFFEGGHVTGVSPDTLPVLAVSDLMSEETIDEYFETLDKFFSGKEELLGTLLSALTLCARDKRQSIRVVIDDTLEQVSECGRRLMELMMCCLRKNDAFRVSFSTLQTSKKMEMHYTICFSPPAERKANGHEFLFDLNSGQTNIGQNITLPDIERYQEIAQQLLRHDLQRAELFRGEGYTACATPDSLQMTVRPFEKGMSLLEYVEGWRAALELRRPLLTERGFKKLLSKEWEKLLGTIIDVSEEMENLSFLMDFNKIIQRVYREMDTSPLTPNDTTLTDMLVLIIDSIRWRELNLADTKTWRLIRTITGYSDALKEVEYARIHSVAACQIIHQMMMNPSIAWETLGEWSILAEDAPEYFESVQDCLTRYIQSRLQTKGDIVDETFVAAAMLGLVKFSDGIPDLRTVDRLAKRIEVEHTTADANHFTDIIDKMRQHLHTPTYFRNRDMKTLMGVCGLLLALILIIWLWFIFHE